MRVVGILIATALVGLGLGVLFVEPDIPGAHDSTPPGAVRTDCEQGLCESATWLRPPAMRRAPIGR